MGRYSPTFWNFSLGRKKSTLLILDVLVGRFITIVPKKLSLSSTFRRFWRSLVRPTNCDTNTRSSSKDAWMKECTVHALQGQVGALGRLIEDDFFSLKVISEVHPKIKASV